MLRIVTLFLFTLMLSACPAKKDSPAPSSTAPANSAAAPAPAPAPAAAPSTVTFSAPDQAVKGFFDAVNNKNYDVAWNALSSKSQAKIISMVASDEKMEPADVKTMFDQNTAPIQRGFWDSFRNSSKTSEFAPAATYKTLSESGDTASVELSSGNVKLEIKAFKEGPGWKAGYIETFME